MSADYDLIRDLRERSPSALPDGFCDAPILDAWRIRRAFGAAGPDLLVCEGAISAGDGRFPAGRMITTSPLTGIDGDNSVLRERWCRSANTLYRLGSPGPDMAPLLWVGGAAHWGAAFAVAIEKTGLHTLPAAVHDAVNTLREWAFKDGLWDEKRSYAARVFEAVMGQGRFRLMDAWAYLAADPSDPISAAATSAMFENTPGVDELGALVRVRDAWRFYASENVSGDPKDHVAGAHELGRILIKRDLTADQIFVEIAKQPKRSIALARALELLPDSVAKDLREIAADADTTRPVYDRYVKESTAPPAVLDLLRLLAVDPDNFDEVHWVVQRLSAMRETADQQEAYRTWRALDELLATDVDAPDEDDAFAAATIARMRTARANMRSALLSSEASREKPLQDDPDGVVVLPSVGGTTATHSGKEALKEFAAIAGRRLKLHRVPPLAPARRRLQDEFPHLHAEIDFILYGMIEGQPLRMRPTLFVGEPGGGKSRIVRRLAEELGIYVKRFDGAGSSDNAFGGTPRRWSSGEHCVPLEAVRCARVANPWVIVEEIDKAGRGGNNGSLADALVTLIEPESARVFPDPFVQSEVDLSRVGYIMTANDDTALPAPLRDRLWIVRLPRPKIEHLPQIARSVVADIAADSPLGTEWFPPLEDGELAVAESLWPGGSVRRLAAIVRALIESRERRPRN